MDGVQIIEWRDGHEVVPPVDLREAIADPATLVWVDLAGADAKILENLANQLSLDPRAVEDALTPGERPKLTQHPGHSFVTCFASRLVEAGQVRHQSRLVLPQIAVFLLPHGILTVRPDKQFDMDVVVRRWRELPELVAAGSAGLLHCLLDVVVDGHFATIQELDDVAEEFEEELFAEKPRPAREVQQSLYRLHKELVQLRRAVLPLREVVSTLTRHYGTGELAGEYADLYDHVIRASEWTESLRDMVTAMFETHVSLLDSRLNVVMKKLAGWAAVVAVPTAITGWFGQNVPFPGFDSVLGLALSAGLILALTGGVYGLLRYHDWI